MKKNHCYKQISLLRLLAINKNMVTHVAVLLLFISSVSAMASSVPPNEITSFTDGDVNKSEELVPQDTVITGTVVDVNGVTLPGVTIYLKGSSIGVVSSFDGTYTIDVPIQHKTLVFAYMGMVTQEVALTGQTEVNVTLLEENESLDEVVVVGYQSIKKKDATASIVSVKAEDIENFPASTFEDVLQGQLAGVNIQSLSGEPGVKDVFVIRGNTNISSDIDGELSAGGTGFSNPLYVLDGVPTTLEDLAGFDATNTNFLASLNPNDIESIDILKDASAAAIYGSRGANGVVLIKTKRGKIGAPVFTFNTYLGVSNTPDLVDVETGTAERAAKYDLLNNYWNYDRIRDNVPMILSDSLNPAFNNNVNYQGLFYQPGIIQNYDFGVSGGSEKSNYRVNLGYYDEEGIVVGTGFSRISASINLGIKINDKIDNQTVVRLGYVDRQTGLGNTNASTGTFPINPLRMNSSLLYMSPLEESALLGRYDDIRNVNINYTVSFSNTLRAKLVEGLYFNNTVSLSTNSTKRDYFVPSTINSSGESYAEYTTTGTKNVNMDNFLSYTKTYKEVHSFNALAGTSLNYNQSDLVRVGGRGSASDQIQTVTGIDQEDIFGRSTFSENGMLSFWGRLGYRFDEKYLVDLNFRADASSRFGSNTRWGYFPAISAGWVFSEESFVQDALPWISFGKLYASYGVNGSQFSDDYLRFNTYDTGSAGYGLGTGTRPVSSYNGTTVVTPNYNKIANQDLSWERSKQWNLALDLELFNRRVFMTPEIYNRETEDLLFDVDFPVESGYNKSQANIAGVRNYGWEFSLNAYVFDPAKDFQWQVGFNVAHNTNQITALPNGNRDWVTGTRSLTVGEALNSYYFLQNTGEVYSTIDDIPVDPYTGGLLPIQYNGSTKVGSYGYVDVDGDYIIEFGDDHIVIPGADPNPKYVGGITNTFSYKNWNLRIVSSFTADRTIFNQTLVTSLWGISKDNASQIPYNWSNYNTPVLSNFDYWRQPGDVTKYASLDPGGNNYLNNRTQQSIWLEDGDYFKIGSVTLSYNFDRALLKRIGFKGLRVYGTMTNVATFQKFSGPDAERVNVAGYDMGSGYAQPRKVTLGMNVKF
ncbi:SusC/RagA family TonB-linked outer membrane protein [Formosa sp. 4Alg 33]|uniref:SusC/RagA family TonB-linked outer membrane protein n=1 Tax=Formosa sp. 4Alg 33 TaxID=3382189 RepID=UPI003D9C1C15